METRCKVPEYTIRKSKRARNVTLHLSPDEGLVVVMPHRLSTRCIPSIVKEKQAWIAKHYPDIEMQRARLKRDGVAEKKPPRQINFRAIDERWYVSYRNEPDMCIRIDEDGDNRLVVTGDVQDYEYCMKSLQKWVHSKAHNHLVPWLDYLSKDTRLSFRNTLVKNQRTRWASCSYHKTISINQKLLFIPEPLVNYIFIHELCHTVHLNHSQKFWNLVARKEPNFEEYEHQIRHKAWQKYIPAWSDLRC